jgi:hypothetical protein
MAPIIKLEGKQKVLCGQKSVRKLVTYETKIY